MSGRLEGVGLNAAGRREAEALAASLAARPLAAIVCSPLQRAVETASPLATRRGLATRIDPGFAEIDFGDWTGADLADLDSDPSWRAFNRFRSTAPVPGGETALAVQARAVAALLRLHHAHPDAELAVVSHAEIIRVLLAHALAVPLDLARRIEVLPAHRSVLVLFDEDARVDALNLPPG